MSEIDDEIARTPHYFIPHQYVLRAQSTSTKLRVVFDASCQTSSQNALNVLLGSSAVEESRRPTIATTRRTSSEQVANFKELRIEEQANAIREFASKSGCEFAFIPPRAPHFGGLWEAGVKSAKHLLLRTVGSLLLTAEELQTTIVAVEAVLNSRPLGAITEDPINGEALTPGNLLVGDPLRALPTEGTPDQQGLICLNRWRTVSLLKQQFWRRWSEEYVLGLQVRNKWQHRLPNVITGELVVVAEDNLPPQLISRVTAVHAGENGVVRVAEIRTASGGKI
ncbi:uncharacterized protein LOC135427809 [Drosophila montana]|uniref:uncharacterized protein LOC135427809 n=1 Tax=Drosophila montana TaxID=40370 RepID=UPI00313F2F41